MSLHHRASAHHLSKAQQKDPLQVERIARGPSTTIDAHYQLPA